VGGALLSAAGGFGPSYTEGAGSIVLGGKRGMIDGVLAFSLASEDRSGLKLPFDCMSTGTCKASPLGATFAMDDTSKDDKSKPINVFAKAGLRLSEAANLTIDGSFVRFDAGGEFQDWQPLTHRSRILENNMFARLAFDGVAGKSSYRAFAAYVYGKPGDDERVDVTYGPTPAQYFRRRVDYKGLDAGAEYRLQLGDKSSITVGTDTSIEDQQLQVFDSINTMTGMVDMAPSDRMMSATVTKCLGTGRCGFNNIAGYLQGIYYPISKLGMTAGFRVDKHNIYGVQPNGRFGVVFLPSEKVALKALYGGSFKAPSPVQLFTQPLQGGDVRGNENLKAQSANTFEGAAVVSPIRPLRLEVTAFVTFISDQVQFLPMGANQLAMNVGDVRSIGSEAEISYQVIQPLRTFVQVSYVQSEVTVMQAGQAAVTRDLTDLYPSLTLRGGALYASDRNHFSAGLDGAYVASRGASQENIRQHSMLPYSVDPYFLLGVSAGTRNIRLIGQRETAFRVRADNVLNQKFVEPGFAGIDVPSFGARVWATLSQEI
jgi:iron complex outermembrane receptor protein